MALGPPRKIGNLPQTAHDWDQVPDAQLVNITQLYPWAHVHTNIESNRRLTAAIVDFKRSADRASTWIIVLTVALALLTLALVVDAVLRHFE
jgi:hypothetical protein